MATAALVLAGHAKLAIADGRDSGTVAQSQQDEASLPFSAADFGWVLLVAAILLVLAIGLQMLARRRRRAMRALARQRTNP